MPLVDLAALVQAGLGPHLLSFPTDTVPALAAQPHHAALIYAAKQRSQDKPLILMGATAADLWPYTSGSAAEQRLWQQVAERYWPGALTLVLPASPKLPPAMNPTGAQTIGLRVPDRAIARHILAQTGPLATTSINRSGQPPLQSSREIAADFPQVFLPASAAIDAIEPQPELDRDRFQGSGMPSTVVQWVGQDWQILRQGQVTFAP